MTIYKAVAVKAFLLIGAISCNAFTPAINPISRRTVHTSTTELFIIGPFIKKMRAEQEKKNMPMASPEERQGEAPGLRVGTGAWKWPPIWPYASDEFIPNEDLPSNQPNMAAMLTGSAGALPSPEEALSKEEDKLDVMQYWGEEKSDIMTEIPEKSAKMLTEHYRFYLRDGMDVLELGAAEESYLPEGLKLSSHIGVGACQSLMDKNPALTKSFVTNLNDVIPENGMKSEELRAMGTNKFDVILMANTIDFLTNPREVFRSAWFLLKPGGTMIVPFTNTEAYSGKFDRVQTRMWRERNDDQHMWICGSFFQFSAGDGWKGLKGFDTSPEGANLDQGIKGRLAKNKGLNTFVVQATKVAQEESIDESDVEKSFSSKMWLLPTVQDRDKQLLAPRMARVYNALGTEEAKNSFIGNIDLLPGIYETLIKMDQFAFTFSMQAQLATDLITDPNFDGNDEQMLALKMGLGLRTPSETFWEPVGQLTMSVDPESKVNLLAHTVPRFGSGNIEQDAALEAFVSGLSPTFKVLRAKCVDMSEEDIQLLGTELLAAEILVPGRSSREEFALWVGSIDVSELEAILKRRKGYKETAVSEMKQMQADRQAEVEQREALMKKMREQQEEARKQRSMGFNPETGKFEKLE